MVENVLKPILNLFIKPVSTTNEQAKKATLKTSFIYVAIISAIFTICNAITIFFNTIITKDYDYKLREYVTKFDISNIKFPEMMSQIFISLISIFLVIIAFATIMYVITKILKNDNSFAKLLMIVSYAMIPFIASCVFSLLTSWLYAPIAMFVSVAASAYALYIMIYSFRNTLTIENEDKLALCNIITITGFTIIGYFLLASMIEDIFSSLF